MKLIAITFAVLVFVSASFGQRNKVLEGAQKDLNDLRVCNTKDVRLRVQRILRWVDPSQLGVTRDEIMLLGKNCIIKQYQPQELLMKIRTNNGRSGALAKLSRYVDETDIPLHLLELNQRDLADLRQAIQWRRQLETSLTRPFPTLYPDRRGNW